MVLPSRELKTISRISIRGAEIHHTYSFDGFVLDLTSGFLLHDGREVKLRPKVFDALKHLIENHGRLVAKAELIQAVWSDSFVTDDSLVQCIVELRRALGDDSQQLVRTVPRRGYTFVAEVRENRGTEILVAQETKRINSLAVLPLENTSGDPEIEYLSDGISESLIDNLSQLPGMKVIARTSSFKYKGKDVNPQSVARALGVQAVISGRVSKRGDQLQIRAELIDARDETHIWGEQYSRGSMDLLSVQSEISKQIAEKLRLRLISGERRQTSHDKVKPEAYELLLRARFYRNKGGTDNLKKAISYYERAIDTDPTYALAHAELSARYSSLIAGGILDPRDYLPKAEAEARRALELDASLAEAHFALGGINHQAWDWAAAEREFQRAIESNPNLAVAHGGYAYSLSLMGQHERAIEEVKRARELDPISLPTNVGVGLMLYFARQHDQSIAILSDVLELDPSYSFAHLYLGYNYAAQAMHTDAIKAFETAIKRGDNTLSVQAFLAVAHAKAGQRKKAQTILKSLQASSEFVSPCKLAILYDSLGERERAFASLEAAYDAHDFQLATLLVDPAFDGLRNDRRFGRLLRRVGLN